MGGYIYFEYTGERTVDAVLEAVQDAGDARHNTPDWGDPSPRRAKRRNKAG